MSVSDLLEEVNEQEWKNNHVTHRNVHSALLFSAVSVILLYWVYKLYPYISKWATIWFCRKETPATPTDVSYAVGQDDQESTVNTNSKGSKNSLNVTDAAPSSPNRASHPRVSKSHF
jgi:hypothetical protein